MMATNHTTNQSGQNIGLGANNQFWPGAVVFNFSEGSLTKNSLNDLSIFGSAVAVDYSDFGVQITINKDLPQALVINHHCAPSIQLKLGPKVCAHVLHYFGQNNKPDAQTCSTLNLDLDHSSMLHYFLVYSAEFTGYHSLEINAKLNTNTGLNFFDFSLHKGEVKSDYTVNLYNQDAQLKYHAFSNLAANAKCSSSLKVLHNSPNTSSEQTFRGIYGHHATGSFLGKVVIDKIAHKSSARQHYKAILLDKSAKAYVMPQLEVNNSDISASHGASIGELDVDALFYLRARGLCENDAKAMLIASLSSQVTDSINDAKIKSWVNRHVDDAIKNSFGADL